MYGLAAIQHTNGWAMAGAGACIVLTGLTVLSFLISMIPWLTNLFEKKVVVTTTGANETGAINVSIPEDILEEFKGSSTLHIKLEKEFIVNFTLFDLHKKLKETGIAAPHMFINRLRAAGVIYLTAEGHFSWKSKNE